MARRSDWFRRLSREPSPVSDARPVEDARIRHDPERQRRRRLRRGTALFAMGAVFVAGLLAATVGQHGFVDAARRGQELEERLTANAALRLEVAYLRYRVDRLQEREARERVARERFDRSLRDEITFLLPSP